MIGNHTERKVVLVTGPIDFRAGVNKLVSLVANALHKDPYCGHVFVFRSKRADRLKLIHFDGTGMCLMTKWLGGGLSGISCVGWHNGKEGPPICHDAKNHRYPMSFWTSC